jgi:ArsR family transcriptional regulator, arsenate/arsenite/antimonite-responsive transcriptional repressor
VLNDAFKALSDPTRRQVLALLRKSGELSAGALAEHFDMTKPTMSHHFAVLKDAGLVKSRREGQQIFYSLNTTVVEDVVSLFLGLVGKGGPPDGNPKR